MEGSEVESSVESIVGRSDGAVRDSNLCALWVWLSVARVSHMTVTYSVYLVYAHSRPTWQWWSIQRCKGWSSARVSHGQIACNWGHASLGE